jgi:hypothetical protein
MAACYAAAAQGISPLRLIASLDPARPPASDTTDPPIAEVRGINIMPSLFSLECASDCATAKKAKDKPPTHRSGYRPWREL